MNKGYKNEQSVQGTNECTLIESERTKWFCGTKPTRPSSTLSTCHQSSLSLQWLGVVVVAGSGCGSCGGCSGCEWLEWLEWLE